MAGTDGRDAMHGALHVLHSNTGEQPRFIACQGSVFQEPAQDESLNFIAARKSTIFQNSLEALMRKWQLLAFLTNIVININ